MASDDATGGSFHLEEDMEITEEECARNRAAALACVERFFTGRPITAEPKLRKRENAKSKFYDYEPYGCQEYRYDLPPGTLRKWLEYADYRCSGCDRKLEMTEDGRAIFQVDHDHSHSCRQGCGKCVRGLLHPKCNLALGLVNDNAATLVKLAEYLDFF